MMMVDMRERPLALYGGLVIAAAVVAFVAYIAVAGLNRASELAGVVSALVAIAGLGLAVYGAVSGPTGRSLPPWVKTVPPLPPDPPKPKKEPVRQTVRSGTPPWTVSGFGISYSVTGATRTTSEWQGTTRPSITITADLIRTRSKDYFSLEFGFSDKESGRALEEVPGTSSGDRKPRPNQRSSLVTVLFDISPPTRSLTITVHDFFWSDRKYLSLEGVPVSPMN